MTAQATPTCPTGKRRYRNRKVCLGAINTHLARLEDHGRPAPAELAAYRCRHCRDWHMTSHPRRTP